MPVGKNCIFNCHLFKEVNSLEIHTLLKLCLSARTFYEGYCTLFYQIKQFFCDLIGIIICLYSTHFFSKSSANHGFIGFYHYSMYNYLLSRLSISLILFKAYIYDLNKSKSFIKLTPSLYQFFKLSGTLSK